MTHTPTSGAADLLAMVSKALREAYNLGMMYWQQADSDYISQHKKSDDTRAKFLALVEETCAALAAGQATAAQPAAQQGVAYAALPEYGINTASHAHFRVLGFTADQMRTFADATHTLRASHGQAPAETGNSVSAQTDSVLEDAARYRWLREGNDAKHGAAWHVAVNLYGCEWDAAIDAARKQGASQ